MRKYFFLPVLLLAILLLTAERCADDSQDTLLKEEARLMEEIENIKVEFVSDYLKSESLFAFEKKAKQKLRDYADYVAIVNDNTLDTSFRKLAYQMMQDLFYHQEVPVLSNTSEYLINIDSVKTKNPLQRVSESKYIGELRFKMAITEIGIDDTLIIGPQWYSIKMIGKKTSSSFGSDTLQIWKVFLGDVNVLSK